MSRDEGGLALLYTALLLPTFLILFAFVVELGALRVTRARLIAAADLAATIAVNQQDLGALARDGTYRVPPEATATARAVLADELRPLGARLAGTTPEQLAARADVALVDGARAVRVSFDAPVRAPLLLLAALRDTAVVGVSVRAAAR